MSQKLILPLDKLKITANYQNAKYLALFGFPHYGIDAISTDGNAEVKAVGTGEIIAAGQDASALNGTNSRLGNCIVAVYKDVLCNDGKVRDLACRMYHFDRLLCKAGDKITAGTVLGVYGSTGAYITGAHLHIEFDTDIKYPQHAIGLSQNGNIIKKGTVNSTVNPSSIWFIGEGQKISGDGGGWTADADVKLPVAGKISVADDTGEIDRLKNQVINLSEKLEQIKKIIAS